MEEGILKICLKIRIFSYQNQRKILRKIEKNGRFQEKAMREPEKSETNKGPSRQI